jgi:hypothetical protein
MAERALRWVKPAPTGRVRNPSPKRSRPPSLSRCHRAWRLGPQRRRRRKAPRRRPATSTWPASSFPTYSPLFFSPLWVSVPCPLAVLLAVVAAAGQRSPRPAPRRRRPTFTTEAAALLFPSPPLPFLSSLQFRRGHPRPAARHLTATHGSAALLRLGGEPFAPPKGIFSFRLWRRRCAPATARVLLLRCP